MENMENLKLILLMILSLCMTVFSQNTTTDRSTVAGTLTDGEPITDVTTVTGTHTYSETTTTDVTTVTTTHTESESTTTDVATVTGKKADRKHTTTDVTTVTGTHTGSEHATTDVTTVTGTHTDTKPTTTDVTTTTGTETYKKPTTADVTTVTGTNTESEITTDFTTNTGTHTWSESTTTDVTTVTGTHTGSEHASAYVGTVTGTHTDNEHTTTYVATVSGTNTDGEHTTADKGTTVSTGSRKTPKPTMPASVHTGSGNMVTSASSSIQSPTGSGTTKTPSDSGSTYAPVYSYKLNLDEVLAPIEFSVSIDQIYNASLSNKTSKNFIELENQFRRELLTAYQNISTFRYINTISFQNGSIVYVYEAVFTGAALSPDRTTNIQQEITTAEQIITTLKIGNYNMTPPNMTTMLATALNKVSANGRCNAYINPCKSGFYCENAGLKCMSYCLLPENKCQNSGQCYQDSVTNTTNCRCAEGDDSIYSGRYCQNKVEKLALSSTKIIIISVTAGGGIIVILVIIIVILVVTHRRRRRDKKQSTDGNFDIHRSISMTSLNMDRWSNKSMQQSRGHNEYQSGLPGTKFFSGREHMVLKDNLGSETYVYQPHTRSSQSRLNPSASPDSEAWSTMASSTYDYIDTEINYHIKRPTVSLGYRNQI